MVGGALFGEAGCYRGCWLLYTLVKTNVGPFEEKFLGAEYNQRLGR